MINWTLVGELLLRSVTLTFMLVGLFGLYAWVIEPADEPA